MGRVIGHWILDAAPIGQGSFAIVWKARHSVTGQQAAVKEINTDKLNQKLKESLTSEINVLEKTRHRNIVGLLDLIKEEGRIFLVLEFCGGGDLGHYLRRYGRVTEATAWYLLQQLAEGLKMLRTNNLIHRDLKPQNLLLSDNTRQPVLKIADFGFARNLQPQGLAETLCGSPLYMAPEILQFTKYDAKADLWSVGTILFELLAGKPPYNGGNHIQLLQNIERGNGGVLPEAVAATLSPACKQLLHQLLRRNPVERIGFEEFFSHAFLATPPPVAMLQHVSPRATYAPGPPFPGPHLARVVPNTATAQHQHQPQHQHQQQLQGKTQDSRGVGAPPLSAAAGAAGAHADTSTATTTTSDGRSEGVSHQVMPPQRGGPAWGGVLAPQPQPLPLPPPGAYGGTLEEVTGITVRPVVTHHLATPGLQPRHPTPPPPQPPPTPGQPTPDTPPQGCCLGGGAVAVEGGHTLPPTHTQGDQGAPGPAPTAGSAAHLAHSQASLAFFQDAGGGGGGSGPHQGYTDVDLGPAPAPSPPPPPYLRPHSTEPLEEDFVLVAACGGGAGAQQQHPHQWAAAAAGAGSRPAPGFGDGVGWAGGGQNRVPGAFQGQAASLMRQVSKGRGKAWEALSRLGPALLQPRLMAAATQQIKGVVTGMVQSASMGAASASASAAGLDGGNPWPPRTPQQLHLQQPVRHQEGVQLQATGPSSASGPQSGPPTLKGAPSPSHPSLTSLSGVKGAAGPGLSDADTQWLLSLTMLPENLDTMDLLQRVLHVLLDWGRQRWEGALASAELAAEAAAAAAGAAGWQGQKDKCEAGRSAGARPTSGAPVGPSRCVTAGAEGPPLESNQSPAALAGPSAPPAIAAAAAAGVAGGAAATPTSPQPSAGAVGATPKSGQSGTPVGAALMAAATAAAARVIDPAAVELLALNLFCGRLLDAALGSEGVAACASRHTAAMLASHARTLLAASTGSAASAAARLPPGTPLPRGPDVVYAAALQCCRAGAADELLGFHHASVQQYAKAADLLLFLLADIPVVRGVKPVLCDVDAARVHKYYVAVKMRQRANLAVLNSVTSS